MLEKKTGFILINKPVGPTSHDIVDQLRKITRIKKIGHAGTLDPFASGVLIIAIGREATKRISQFVKLDKEYVLTIKLGAVSDTFDRTGKITKIKFINKEIKLAEIKKTLKRFVGKQEQVPPMYSAKKIKGEKLYELARQGKVVKREPINIEIFSIKLINYQWPKLKIRVKCSSGTYMRALAHDMGWVLGCGGFAEKLERTKIAHYDINKTFPVDILDKNNWSNYLFTF